MNTQPIEKRVDSSPTLSVHSVFYTIQGEGPFCGTPCVFVRLAGCNLQCPKCDTDYTTNRRDVTVEELVSEVRLEFLAKRFMPEKFPPQLVVITGGEPFRQPIGGLITSLVNEGYFVQIESNGTLPPPKNILFNHNVSMRYGAYIVCSPKTGSVHSEIASEACCYKYVMDSDSCDVFDGLPVRVLGNGTDKMRVARPPKKKLVYLQPADEKDPAKNKQHLKACIQSCITHGYILQLQVHKLIGME